MLGVLPVLVGRSGPEGQTLSRNPTSGCAHCPLQRWSRHWVSYSQQGNILLPRGHLQRLGTFWLSRRQGRRAAGVQWVEPVHAAQPPTMHRMAPPERIICPQMSAVPRNGETSFQSTLARSPCLREAWSLRPTLLEEKGD